MKAAAAQRDVSPMQPDIDFALAEYAIGQLPSERAPEVAAALLASGEADPDAATLALMRAPTWSDARALFESAVAATGRTIPHPRFAYLRVIQGVLDAMVAGTVTPRSGAGRLGEIWSATDHRHNLSVFVALADDWDEYPEQRGEIETSIVAEAQGRVGEFRAGTG